MAHKIDLGVAIRVVDKYDGDAASLQSWLDNVDVLRADDPEVPEVSFITFLKSRLVGAARGSLEGVQTLAVAKATLKEKFAVQLTPIAVEVELRSLKQRSGRTVIEFGSEIEKLATKLAAAWVSKGPPFTTEASARPVVEPIAVHTFINGLRDKSAAYLVKSRNPKTLTLAISDALEVQPQSSTEPAFWAQGNRVPHFSNHFSNRNPGRRGGRRFNNNNRGYRHNNNNQRNYNQGYCNNNHGYDNHNPGYFNNNQGYNYNNRSNLRNFNNNHNNLNNNYPNNNYQNNNNNNNNGNNAPRNNNNLNNNNNPQRRNANVAEEPQEQQPRAEANVKQHQIINGRVYVGTESPEIAQNMVQSHIMQHELEHNGKPYSIPLSMKDGTIEVRIHSTENYQPSTGTKDEFTLCEKRPGVPNGVRILRMILSKPILSYVHIDTEIRENTNSNTVSSADAGNSAENSFDPYVDFTEIKRARRSKTNKTVDKKTQQDRSKSAVSIASQISISSTEFPTETPVGEHGSENVISSESAAASTSHNTEDTNEMDTAETNGIE
ncbi:putative uncharacterized protein DDB_G0282499 [Wyeomyia smithii]|uniref:putative uncharacterized protein DDB_G0282499 n=1 Tax=Wyeomyia smithii TaxID=174621 RepID=UPI002467C413|nr:putative uncharacterized protein DDB_G0282499 [Wyeomyia smithii]